jgi:hypothetical protein
MQDPTNLTTQHFQGKKWIHFRDRRDCKRVDRCHSNNLLEKFPSLISSHIIKSVKEIAQRCKLLCQKKEKE